MCRHIHLLGEDEKETIIRLDDNARGFREIKPVIAFNTASRPFDTKETTNCAMQNTVMDLTIDCGKGNDKAIGIYYVSSNLGRIERVTVQTESGYCGIYYDLGSQGVFRDITVSGFDYGMDTYLTSPIVLERVDASRCKKAGMIGNHLAVIEKNCKFGELPAFELREGNSGRLYCYDKNAVCTGHTEDKCIQYHSEHSLLPYRPMPEQPWKDYGDDYVLVEDFGAKDDGVTDCTRAIQRAMNSGKKAVLFGSGPYLITRTIRIPKTVQVIDFMYGELFAGIDLISGEVDSVFEIGEESEETLLIKNLSAHDKFYGHFRCFKHSAKRDVMFSDVYTACASLYFNTVGGSRVYIDNVFSTNGSYSQDLILKRRGYLPVFAAVLPWEFHSQTVIANNLNVERADIELLNDASEIYIDGYKTEGPGNALTSINGGKTKINIANHGIWKNMRKDNMLFRLTDSELELSCSYPFSLNPERDYCTAFVIDGEQENLFDVAKKRSDDAAMIPYFEHKK